MRKESSNLVSIIQTQAITTQHSYQQYHLGLLTEGVWEQAQSRILGQESYSNFIPLLNDSASLKKLSVSLSAFTESIRPIISAFCLFLVLRESLNRGCRVGLLLRKCKGIHL